MSETTMWQAVRDNDARLDGQFIVAVKTTGIYCRPSCRARLPKRENVAFYPNVESARKAGFRACRRCHPDDSAGDPQVALVRKVVAILDQADAEIPTLAALAAEVGASPSHLQRVFSRIMGLSPRAYAESRRHGRFRQKLKAGDDIAGALYESGYGSSSRVYENAVSRFGMTPATYKKGGLGANLRFAVADCALGRIIVAATETGIAFVGFGDDDAALERELRAEFPAAEIDRDDRALGVWVQTLVGHLAGGTREIDLPLDVCATAFQWRVWQALRSIPYGELRTYKEIAAIIGAPTASRAVGRACATNPVSIVIPCHRALGSDGRLHGYRWGLERKQQLLTEERAG
ncbi:MAG: bifunctional DNA-binding transcriptional regulator/O6-methylguanine-DNA methyltransferase Ada [Alphaproteobacteria bacterium]|nr:bifunctional DNA-binding transcriptional regulator/O6-methylguanine-DNA methyltransferase Ada [Alphaproteobacteria bacterium]